MSFTDEEINEAFSEFDKDGNQVIECSELKGFIKKNCPEIEDCDIEALFMKFDDRPCRQTPSF